MNNLNIYDVKIQFQFEIIITGGTFSHIPFKVGE